MSEKRAKFVGHPDEAYLEGIPVGTDGDTRRLHVPYGSELPAEIDGLKVDTKYRDSLLEQEANWTVVNRATGSAATGKTTTAAKAGKEGDS
jgi:hypothetical protein